MISLVLILNRDYSTHFSIAISSLKALDDMLQIKATIAGTVFL